MNDILRPITDDGRLGFDEFDQLFYWTKPDVSGARIGTIVADVRDSVCPICNHGWELQPEAFADQTYWYLIEEFVHESCLVRHHSFVERADFERIVSKVVVYKLGLSFSVELIKNGYWPGSISHSKKPWYRFSFKDLPVTLVIGHRKRVTSISVEPKEGKTLGWWNDAKKALSKEDVTKGFSGQEIFIHAWTNEKVAEYVDVFLGLAAEQVER